jgi:DNA-binding LytR/AlgR family response regulator
MNLTCIIVEDEPLARNLLTQYVSKMPSLTLLQAFSNPLEAMSFLRNNPTDILFLDIQMPEITGIMLLKILQKKPIVILTTAYSEYALEGYELDVTDYLLKPITFDRFVKAVEKATQRINFGGRKSDFGSDFPKSEIQNPKYTEGGQNAETPNNSSENSTSQPFIFVKDGTKLVKVRLNDILYIEGLKDYVTIHTTQKKIVTLQRMKILETQLPENQFVRIHNSYLVSLEAIDVIHKERVQIGTTFLPISDTYRKTFKEFIERNNIRLE